MDLNDKEDHMIETIEETEEEIEETTNGNDWNPKTWKQHREEQMMLECHQSRNIRQAKIKIENCKLTNTKRKHVDSDDDATIKSPNVSVANTSIKNKLNDDDVIDDNLLDGYSETSPEMLLSEKKMVIIQLVLVQKLLNVSGILILLFFRII